MSDPNHSTSDVFQPDTRSTKKGKHAMHVLSEEIGRGSFGAVHLAKDQYGQEYAIKEFSKSRLRRRAKSHMLRRARQTPRMGMGNFTPQSPLERKTSPNDDLDNSFDLIREEIAIMKKLNHGNLVNLIEVLDDPEEDSLYMVLEMCKKGVIMKVEVDQPADRYDDESCRCWFRDLILGIEYLHAQGVVHRDIKPDNCLLTEDDTLKIVDFGVSEMFEKTSEMKIAKSAGSPAFMAPELCMIKKGDVFGRPADIWSMGVTLYCLKYGRVPFQESSVLELYNAIINDTADLSEETDAHFRDLMTRILEKNPQERITMEVLRDHPWVTKSGEDPLMPASENCSEQIEPPTEEEKNAAITGNMGRAMTVMRAAKRFKALVDRKSGKRAESILGKASEFVQPPLSMAKERIDNSKSAQKVQRGTEKGYEQLTFALTGRQHTADFAGDIGRLADRVRDKVGMSGRKGEREEGREEPGDDSKASMHSDAATEHQAADRKQVRSWSTDGGKGHAHDPLEDHLFLNIGANPEKTDGVDGRPEEQPQDYMLSESPPAVGYNVYERAYEEEVAQIRRARGRQTLIYLTRRMEDKVTGDGSKWDGVGSSKPKFSSLVAKALNEKPPAAKEGLGGS